MRDILDEILNGKITDGSELLLKSKEFNEINERISMVSNELEKLLPDGTAKIEHLQNLNDLIALMIAENSWKEGFKVGVCSIIQSMSDKDIGEEQDE